MQLAHRARKFPVASSRLLRNALTSLGLVALALASGGAKAAGYPTDKITVIVAFAPGGIADTLARLVAQGLTERLRQNVVVENRGGASGNIAAAYVARANPDGYTLLATTTALAVNETLFADKQFSTRDFKAVAIAASSPEALMTSPDNPAKDVPDFIKTMSGRTINLAIPGVGTVSHIAAEYFFKQLAKVPVQPIPYQGGAPAINAAVAGQVDLLATTLGGGAAAQIAAGKLKGLGIAAVERAAVAPNMPTYVEQGYPAFTAATWVGFFAPAKTDRQILQTLNAAINDILKSPAVAKKLADMGFDPIVGSQQEADAMLTAEAAKWGDMVKALGLSIK